MSIVGRTILLSSLLVVTTAALASDALTRDPGTAASASDVSDQALFEMCCWARGRAGFNHCVEYGVCKDHPEKGCKGRGAAEGRSMSCDAPPEEPSRAGFSTPGEDYFLLASPTESDTGI